MQLWLPPQTAGTQRILVAFLCGAGLVVPLAQIHDQTAWSIDKHIAYGNWFSVMAAGYGCAAIL